MDELHNMQATASTAKIRKLKAAILSHSNRGTRIQDKGNPLQPGGPSTKGLADCDNWMKSHEIPALEDIWLCAFPKTHHMNILLIVFFPTNGFIGISFQDVAQAE